MRISLTESQLKLIVEANKVDILINKLGLKKEVADAIYELAGPLSVWITNKIIDSSYEDNFEYMMSALPDEEMRKARERYKRDVKYRRSWGVMGLNRGVRSYVQLITSIMDWIRVGLNGDVKPYQDLSLNELSRKSQEWHKSLQVGGTDINYKERNEVVRDYRDKNGNGFYWVNLNTNRSDEECDRMGHCGTTKGGNTLLSLREYKVVNKDYTHNKSHVTCAVGKRDGLMYQSKGPVNSKPKVEFYPYIIDLILNSTNPEIKGFNNEYHSGDDFSILDLPDEKIKEIYQKKPDVFNQYKLKRKLLDLGLIDRMPNLNFTLELTPDMVNDHIKNDLVIGKYKLKNGETKEVYLSETLLKGGSYDFMGGELPELNNFIHRVNNQNLLRIVDILKRLNPQEVKYIETDFSNNVKMVELIKKYDKNNEVSNTLRIACNDAQNEEWLNKSYDLLKKTLGEYGTVTKFDEQGVSIDINVTDLYQKHYGDDYDKEIQKQSENCGDNISCIFGVLMISNNLQPKVDWDTVLDPPNRENFNDILVDRLSKI